MESLEYRDSIFYFKRKERNTMNQKRRLSFRCLSIILAVMMILSALPFTAFAAPSSDIPEEMLENSIIRALEYTGYDVQTQKNNGTIYQSGLQFKSCKYGSRDSFGHIVWTINVR